MKSAVGVIDAVDISVVVVALEVTTNLGPGAGRVAVNVAITRARATARKYSENSNPPSVGSTYAPILISKSRSSFTRSKRGYVTGVQGPSPAPGRLCSVVPNSEASQA